MTLSRKTPLRSSTPLRAVSERRLAELRAAGAAFNSTFVPRQRAGLDREPRTSARRDTGPSAKTRAALRVRSGGWCEYPDCPRPAREAHHRDERGSGGRGVKAPAWINQLANLLDACREHNQWASNGSPAEARDKGWLIPSGVATPYNTPVLTRHHPHKVLLDDAGTWTPVAAVTA